MTQITHTVCHWEHVLHVTFASLRHCGPAGDDDDTSDEWKWLGYIVCLFSSLPQLVSHLFRFHVSTLHSCWLDYPRTEAHLGITYGCWYRSSEGLRFKLSGRPGNNEIIIGGSTKGACPHDVQSVHSLRYPSTRWFWTRTTSTTSNRRSRTSLVNMDLMAHYW